MVELKAISEDNFMDAFNLKLACGQDEIELVLMIE